MQEDFDQLRQSIVEEIDKRLGGRLDAAEKRLAKQFRIHSESIRETAKTTAANYGGVLESIEQRLTDLSTKWDKKIGDHDRALKNHGKRIQALERGQ